MTELRHFLQSGDMERSERPPWAQNPWKPPQDLTTITQRSIDVLLSSKREDGGIHGIGWWQQANAYTAIALHDSHLRIKLNYEALADLVRRSNGRKTNLINEFNDDSLWWGLCSLHLYAIGRDTWFLNVAKAVWEHLPKTNSIIQRGQIKFKDMDMEGGCFWTTNPNEEQINAVTTGLFAELSVRLALHEQNSRGHLDILLRRSHPACTTYIDHARRCLGWILRCRYRPKDAVVLDNILIKKQEARDWIWSYNTGVAIGVCALLYEATGEYNYLSLACVMANKAMRRASWVEPNGVLDEPGAYGKGKHDPAKNNDAVGFKSVLMRHLGTLYSIILRQAAPSDAEARGTADLIKVFVNVNLQSQLERNTDNNGRYGPWWNGPFEMPTSHSQMAVLDVMATAVLVNRL